MIASMHGIDNEQLEIIKKWLGAGSINLFGRPFAGKDTQSHILADLFDGVQLGGGHILRNSVVPENSRQALEAGELVPTQDYINIVLPYLSRTEFSGKPLLLSSVGRWHGEEPGVIAASESSGHPLKAVFYLNLSEEVAWERWKKDQQAKSIGERGGRRDDTKEILPRRFEEFRLKTLPVIDFYRIKDNLLVEIDASQPSVQVTADIIQELLHRATSE